MRIIVWAGAAALAASATFARAAAPEVKIVDIKVYVFLEHADKLSDDLVGTEGLLNAPRGGAPGGDTATGVLVDLTFSGEKNGAPKAGASKAPAATVDLTQTTRDGGRIVTHKAFDTIAFGPEGIAHKAIYLEGATCMPLDIDARAGRTSKSARIAFQCDAVREPN